MPRPKPQLLMLSDLAPRSVFRAHVAFSGSVQLEAEVSAVLCSKREIGRVELGGVSPESNVDIWAEWGATYRGNGSERNFFL